MKKLFSIIFWILFYISEASKVHQEILTVTPNFSRQFGPKFDKRKMCYGTIISALYSIPCVQQAFYEDNCAALSYSPIQRTVINSMAVSFAKMRINDTKLLDLKNGKEYSGFKSVNTKMTEFLIIFPINIKKLFNFNMRTEVLRSLDSVTLHLLVNERYHKNMHVDSNFTSVSQFIENEFNDEVTNRLTQQKLNLNFPLQVRNRIESNPEVFTIHLNRIIQTAPNVLDTFKSCPFTVDREIVLNSVVYILISRIEYDPETNFYSTVAFDLGDSKTYRYDKNGNVQEIAETEPPLDTKSVLLFYIPRASNLSASAKIIGTKRPHDEISGTVVDQDQVDETKTEEVITVKELGRSYTMQETGRGDSVREEQFPFYRPDCSLIPHCRELFLTIERNLMKKIGIYPPELLDFNAKCSFKIYPLGSQQYSFKPGPEGYPCHALEVILTCLASNSNVVTKLFESPDSQSNLNSVDYHLTIAIIKMLMGCKNISLEKLIKVLRVQIGVLFNTTVDMKLKDSGFRRAIRILLSGIKSSFIGEPLIKIVKYSGLESDDPFSISKTKEHIPIRLDEVIDSREAVIKGIWYDFVDKLGSRRRCIMKSKSEIVVVEVKRWTKGIIRKIINPKSIKLNSADYECVGVVSLGEVSIAFESFFIDNLSGNTLYKSLIPGMESSTYEMNEKSMEYFDRICSSESVLLFFSKKSANVPRKLFSGVITSTLLENVFSDLSEELNFDSNKYKRAF